MLLIVLAAAFLSPWDLPSCDELVVRHGRENRTVTKETSQPKGRKSVRVNLP